MIKSNLGLASGQRDVNAKANQVQDEEINKLRQGENNLQSEINGLKTSTKT